MPEALHNYKKTQTYVVRPHPGSHLMMISRCYKYLNPLDSQAGWDIQSPHTVFEIFNSTPTGKQCRYVKKAASTLTVTIVGATFSVTPTIRDKDRKSVV